MRFHIVLTILCKELSEALRDRRTLFMMVGLPILLYPALMLLMSRLQESQAESQKARTSEVAVWGSLPDAVSAQLTAKGRIKLAAWQDAPAAIRAGLENGALQPPPTPPPDLDANDEGESKKPKDEPDTQVLRAAREVILARKTDAIVVAWPGFSHKLGEGGIGVVSILYDSVRPESAKARDRLHDELRAYRTALLAVRERERGLAAGFAAGVEVQRNDVAPPSRKSGMFLGMVLPYMLILLSAMSGFYAAIDMTAGEKERGTMQTLLCAPVESLEIVTGKFGAIWTIALIGTLVNLASLAATFSRLRLPGISTNISFVTYLQAFPMLLPITMMVTAVFLAVGAFARDFKEGQNYLTPLLMGLLFPLMATMMPGIELNGYLAFAPVVNVALLIKAVFLGEWHADTAFLVIVSSAAYAMMALLFAASVFERNNLLLGGKESLGGIFDFSRRPGSRPTPASALLAFSVILVLLFYGSMALENRGPVAALLGVELALLLAPTLGLAWVKGFDFSETFALRLPHWKGLLGAVLIGLSGWAIAVGLVLRLLPPPESLVRALEKVLMVHSESTPLWQLLLLVAVLPAFCEELLFRGLLLTGFRRLGMWPAVLATAILFGVVHASIYRMGPVTFLGILFAWSVWKTRSIAVGMICHALNNGLMVSVARSRTLSHALGMGATGASTYVPWSVVAAGAVVLALGVWLIRSAPAPLPVTLSRDE